MNRLAASAAMIGLGAFAAISIGACASTVAGKPVAAGGAAQITDPEQPTSDPGVPTSVPTATGGAEPTEVDVFDLEVGNCLAPSDELNEAEEVSTVAIVPCTAEHDGQIYAETNAPDGDFPGSEQIDSQANEFCTTEFEGFVGLSYDESVLDFYPFTPTDASWAEGDRVIQCVAYDPEGPVTGPLQDAGR